MLAQVLSGDAWQGRVELPRGDGSTHDAEVSCTPLRDLDGVKGVLCVIIDFSPEGQRLRDARLLGSRLAMLARVTGELVRAEDLDTLSRIITSHSADAVGATIASLLLREGEDRLRLIALRGGEEGEAEQWASFPIAARTPAGEVVRSGTPVLLTGRRPSPSAIPTPVHAGSAPCCACRSTWRTGPSASSVSPSPECG